MGTGAPVINERNAVTPRSGVAQFGRASLYKKRKHSRFFINLPVEYWRNNDSNSNPGHLANISEGGFMLYLPEPVEIGQHLKCIIFYSSSHDLSTVEAQVQVVWRDSQAGVSGDYRTGGKFVGISPADLERLKAFLKNLDFQVASDPENPPPD